MSEMKTFDVHVRISGNGKAFSVTSDEISSGTTLDDITDGEGGPFSDFRIKVTAQVPVPLAPPLVGELQVPVEATSVKPAVTAELAS